METIIQRTLKLLLDSYGADYDVVTVTEANGHYTANIETQDPPKLIGKGGSIINALQVLLKALMWKSSSEKVFVTVDVDGYRAEKNAKVFARVKDAIEKMQQDNEPSTTLRPMKPYLRRLVHLWIADTYPQLTSEGTGEGVGRAVRIFYK